MTKLVRFMKPYLAFFFAAIFFLFIQAMSDLNLPNLMSDIVDVGLQNNGIETATPAVISHEAMEFMQIFLDDNEIALLNKNYEEKSTDILKEKKEFGKNVSQDTALFLKEDVDEETASKISETFGNASWSMIYFIQDNVDPEVLGQTTDGENGEKSADLNVAEMDITALYEMAPQFIALKQAGQLDEYIKKAKETPSMMKEQTSVKFSQLFYSELGANMATMQRNYILKVGLKMLGIALISVSASICIGYLSSRLAASVSHDLRNELFEKIESFSLEEYTKFSSSSFITRISSDVRQISMLLVIGVRMLFYSPIMVIGGVIMILQTNVSMIWILLVPVVILITLFFIIYKVGMPKFELQQKIIDKINQVSREGLSGMMVVRAFGNEDFEETKFDNVNDESRRNSLFVERLISVVFPVVMVTMNLTTVIILWVGSNQIAASSLQVGDMIAFIQYAMQIVFSFISIAMMFVFIPRANVSAKRVNEVFDIELIITDPETPVKEIESKKGWVEFENVSFSYTGAEMPILNNISFVAKPGEMVAFIGSTGSGKSTVINLIPRLYDVTEGSVKVGGIDVRNQNLKDLRSGIGYVPQESILLSGTIESNLKYGRPDATLEEMQNAVEASQAKEFMENLDDPYNYLITQDATNVSGGQRQRLSIARALTKLAHVYIFDDSFSALDFKTDAQLRRALSTYAKDSSLLVVGQRISSIMSADQIIVLENGEMVGKGTHKELLQTCPTYREIAESQLREEEL